MSARRDCGEGGLARLAKWWDTGIFRVLSHVETNAMIAIAKYQGPGRLAFPSVDTIEAHTPHRRDTIFKALQRLVELGVVEKHGRHQGRYAVEYEILLPPPSVSWLSSEVRPRRTSGIRSEVRPRRTSERYASDDVRGTPQTVSEVRLRRFQRYASDVPDLKVSEKEIENEEPPYPPTGGAREPFDVFWNAYPSKQEEPLARKAFAKAVRTFESPEAFLTVALAAIAEQRATERWLADDGRWIPNPAKWLRREGWKNRAPELPKAASASPVTRHNARVLAQRAAQRAARAERLEYDVTPTIRAQDDGGIGSTGRNDHRGTKAEAETITAEFAQIGADGVQQ
jgi:hypothetical protein